MADESEEATRPDSLRWNVERRLEFIEFQLLWEGRVNRSDIVDRFSVSVNQASGDLSRYQLLAPENITYDKSAKHYRATSEFRPLFLRADANRYLSQLRLVADHVVAREETWLASLPAYDVAATPVRAVDAQVLRRLLAAVRGCEAVYVLYQSVTRPAPSWRWIEPHAFGFDGFRWHTRAWCRNDRRFKDFVLARVLEVGTSEPATTSGETDTEWSTWITLAIGPHPELSPGQKAAIARDYGMEDQCLTIKVRLALLYYVRRRLGLDLAPGLRSAQEQQIVLLNREEVHAILTGTGVAE